MLNRRRFLATSAAAALVGCGKTKPTETAETTPEIPAEFIPEAPPGNPDGVRIAVIGLSGRGGENTKGVAGERIVALCDVDEAKAVRARAQYPKAPFFSDYRKLLDKVGKDIDAVVISTPDHTHAHAALSAIALGKHVYCEKPLCHTIDEVRRVMKAAEA